MEEEIILYGAEKSLGDHLQTLHRRRKTIFAVFLLVLFCGIGYAQWVKPVYRRSVRILVEGKGQNTASSAHDPTSSILPPPYVHDVDTQMEVLKSEIIQTAACNAAGISPKEVLDPLQPRIRVDVKQITATDVIEVSIEGQEKNQVEQLAHTLPAVYTVSVVESRKTEITNALNFARTHKEEERKKLQKAEKEIERFKNRTHLVNLDTERNNHIIEAISADAKMRQAQQTFASAQARLDTAVDARKKLPNTVSTSTSTSNIQQIQAKKEQIAGLQAQKTSLAYYYKPESAEIQQIDKQITDLETQLAAIPPRVKVESEATNESIRPYDDKIAEARGAFTAAQAELDKTRSNATSLASQLNKYTPLERQQAELQRELEEHKNSFGLLSNSVEELSLREKGTHIPVQTLSEPAMALQVAPRPLRYMLVAGLLGLFLGCLFGLLQENLDSRLYTNKSFLAITGTPALTQIPLVEPGKAHLLTQACDSALLEGYRTLRSNIRFAMADTPLNALAVTSTLPNEGKSVTALNLAIAMVYDGYRVILVDADVRCGTLHEKLKLPRDLGLTSVLKGEATLEAALQETLVPGLRFLAAGPATQMPTELLDSRAMRDLQDTLRSQADMVIFDTPAGIATVDAAVIASQTDGVVYVAQPGRVKKEELEYALDSLMQADARILGVIFNKVNAKGNKDYNYFSYQRAYSEKSKLLMERDRKTASTGAAPNLSQPRTNALASKEREV